MLLQFILLIIGAYLIGSIPAGYLATKWYRGTDIRKVGTGKIGAANVLNSGSKWLAVLVALFDIGKGALVVWIAKLIGLSTAQQITVGLFAIVGHDWSVYLKFNSGGRGVFVSLGVISMISWKMGLIAFVAPYLLFAPFKQVALGVFSVFVSFPFLAYFFTGPLGVPDKVAITWGFAVLALIGLLSRTAVRRTALSKNTSLAKVIIYRLLFDRDISDRRLWNSRASTSKV
jgi:acyl phosphate:glycerol-3-phosphate acyltransferase